MTTEIASQVVRANGLNFTCLTAGQGPLVLCFHGFPETPHSFTHLIGRLAAAGYRVVAPYLRSTAPTEAPADGDYSVAAMGRDALALIAALGEERAILIGHDWGAVAAYAAASIDPSRIVRMVTAAVPHPSVSAPSPLWMVMVLFFQVPSLAAHALKAKDGALIDFLYKHGAPSLKLKPEHTAAFKQAISAPGAAERSIAPYRAAFRALRKGERSDNGRLFKARIPVPTMTLVGDLDHTFPRASFTNTGKAIDATFELVTMPGVGHFMHLERPEEFAEHIVRFLGPAATSAGA